jgi:D-alanyl-D-alanine carboxypeptidase
MDLPSPRGWRAPFSGHAQATSRGLAALLLAILLVACGQPGAPETPRPTLAPAAPAPAGDSTQPLPPLGAAFPVPDAAPPSAGDLKAALDRARDAFDISGAELGIGVEDGPVWSGGSGSSWQLGTPVSGETPFVIGSITKTYVAALILQLVDEGRLALDDLVSDHLPDRPPKHAVTVGQLLSHTSGIADVYGPALRAVLEADPEAMLTADELLSYVGEPWSFPGMTFTYSNTNYLLLGLIAEHLTGATLEAEIERRFLEPLELSATKILWHADHEATPLLQPSWASAFRASGSMSSTAGDLVRWGEALYGGSVLSPQSLELMLSFGPQGYGLGAQELILGGRRAVGHTGLLGEDTALLLWLPNERVCLAIMADTPRAELTRMLTHRERGEPSILDLVLRLADQP